MSLVSNLQSLITAIGTDYKQLRVWLTGSSTGDLTALTTTAKNSIVAAINEVKAGASGAPPAATQTQAGVAQVATSAEVLAGTIDTDMVSPLGLQTKVNALAAVARTGSASDITTGTLPSSVLPALAINDTFTVASQAAMLALTAQRGDVAIRTDIGRSFILTADTPATLASWTQLTAGGDVASVAGRTGAVVLTKSDVGLANVDNTSDVNKPVSTAQAAADALNLKIANNLSDLNNAATARTNLSVYSQTELGDPTTDLVAAYTAAKA